jgi:hypothetical protein
MTFKTIVTVVFALIGAFAAALHFFAPQLMQHLGQTLHGGR